MPKTSVFFPGYHRFNRRLSFSLLTVSSSYALTMIIMRIYHTQEHVHFPLFHFAQGKNTRAVCRAR